MKKLLLLMIVPMLALSFNSCSKDDDDGKRNGETVALVKKIYSPTHAWSIEFEYDNQQRLIKVIERDLSEFSAFTAIGNVTYSTNKIAIVWDEDIYEYIYNNDDYLIKYAETDRLTGQEEWSASLTYANGYVSKMTASEGYTQTYTWSDGNMIKSVWSDGDVDTYTYSNHPNKTNLPIPDFLLEWDMALKFKGAFNKNLPSSLTQDYDYGSFTSTRHYSYTFNSDGNPTEIKETCDDGDTSVTYITYY